MTPEERRVLRARAKAGERFSGVVVENLLDAIALLSEEEEEDPQPMRRGPKGPFDDLMARIGQDMVAAQVRSALPMPSVLAPPRKKRSSR